MTTRIEPAQPPYPAPIQAALDRIMRGKPPLVLFTTLARDPRLFEKFFNAGLLDRGNLTIRQREIAIDRTTALCRSEYEWGVHVAIYADRAGLDQTQIRSIVHGGPHDACWSDEERLILRLCDTLHTTASVDDALWQELSKCFKPEALLELVMLTGFYHLVSFLTNALRLPLEAHAARFPAD
jgi:alkylhydroperoxidase family enzyme